MIRVMTDTVATCRVCGDVACEHELLWVEDDDEIVGCRRGDLVCADCADLAPEPEDDA